MLQGFCLPEELSDEMDGEGEGTFNTSEGAGLADGQGAKDVSDQVQATSLSSQSYCSTLLFYQISHCLVLFPTGKRGSFMWSEMGNIYMCVCLPFFKHKVPPYDLL